MGLKLCLDSNVFIAIANREADGPACERIIDAIEGKIHHGVVSTITLAEIEVGYYKQGSFSEARAFAVKVLTDYQLVPVTDEVAIEGAKIRASTGIRLPDALIVATARVTRCDVLITRDGAVPTRPGVEVLGPARFARDHLP